MFVMPQEQIKEMTPVRMSKSMKARIQKYADSLAKKVGVPISFSAATRSLIEVGLDKQGIR